MTKANDEFVEALGSKDRLRITADNLNLNYLAREVKDYYVYPLTTLTGKPLGKGISVSKEKTTILVTTPDKKNKIRAYLADNDLFSITEFADPTNPGEQMLKNSNGINFVTKSLVKPRFDILYLLTTKEITADNFETLDKYLSRDISVDKNDINLISMKFQPLEDFTSFYKSQVIKILLMNPIEDKIKGMSITTPVGALIGNIKAINPQGHTVSLLANEDTEIFPILVFPFQTKPNLGTVKYWNSKQIIPLQEIFDFLDEKGIAYDQEFSLAEFLALGEPTNQPSIHFDNLNKLSFRINRVGYDWKTSNWGNHTSGHDEQDLAELIEFGIGENSSFLRPVLTTNGWSITQPTQVTDTGESITGAEISSTISNFQALQVTSVDVYPVEIGKASSAFEVICQMLTETFWKNLEFAGATKIEVDKNGQKVETIDDEKIYALQEKYSGQDRFAVTTNLWISWKQQNPQLVNDNLDVVKRIENALAMMSGFIKSNYSINKGDNDDYRILLPWYFELQNKLDNPVGFAQYSDIKVKLKSFYGSFTSKAFVFEDKNISKNKIYELEYNHFVFPELTKSPETAQIPSSMPVDQELANGEFSKYLLKRFTKNEDVKKILKSEYGNGEMTYDPIANPLQNSGSFDLQTSSTIEEIEISSFYGYGNWKIALLTDKDETIELDLNLFSKEENDKTLVNLII